MELINKGDSAELGSMTACMLTLTWTAAADFDIAAVYKPKSGDAGMVYFGNRDKVNLNEFPFMQISEDQGVGDTAGKNKEELRIANFADMESVWLVCWDYGAIQSGGPARFEGSDVKIALMDNDGASHAVSLEAGSVGNLSIVAQIDNSSPMGAKLVNCSQAGTLKSFKNLDQIMEIINS